jgi:ribosome-associated protein
MQDPAERPSKTQRKQAMHELQSLGERLLDLPAGDLEALGLPERLREAVGEARRTRSHEGRRRILQYIGKLMRDVDPAPIRERFAALDGESASAIAAHQQIERWRTRLLDDDEALTELARAVPGADLQPLRTAIRAARKERAAAQAPRHFRQIYQLLKPLLDAPAETHGEAQEPSPETS